MTRLQDSARTPRASIAKQSSVLLTGLMLATLATLTLGTTGCFWVTTKREGEKLRADVSAIDTRLAKREDDLEGKIQQLERVLAEATEVLRRNSADLGADVEEVAQDLRRIEGVVAEAARQAEEVRTEFQAIKAAAEKERASIDQRFVALEERLAAIESKAAQPQSADDLYAQGKTAFDGGDSARAQSLFQQLVTRFPGHDRADDAQHYRGEAYYREKDYNGAIREFQKVFDKYPTSTLADDALFRAGEAAQELRRCSEARAYFGLLRQKYPDSSLVKKSKDKDAELKRDLKNTKKCIS